MQGGCAVHPPRAQASFSPMNRLSGLGTFEYPKSLWQLTTYEKRFFPSWGNWGISGDAHASSASSSRARQQLCLRNSTLFPRIPASSRQTYTYLFSAARGTNVHKSPEAGHPPSAFHVTKVQHANPESLGHPVASIHCTFLFRLNLRNDRAASLWAGTVGSPLFERWLLNISPQGSAVAGD